MKREFDIHTDFDPHKCWELGCCEVDEQPIYDEDGNIEDEMLFCAGDYTNSETCPLKKFIELHIVNRNDEEVHKEADC